MVTRSVALAIVCILHVTIFLRTQLLLVACLQSAGPMRRATQANSTTRHQNDIMTPVLQTGNVHRMLFLPRSMLHVTVLSAC